MNHVESEILAVEEEKPSIRGISLRVATFNWMLDDQNFIILNPETYEEKPIKLKVWSHVGFVDLSGILRSGIKTLENVKAKDKDGSVINRTIKTGKIYAYDALSQSLSALGVPISPKECEELVTKAKESGIRFGILVRLNDLEPTSPELYAKMNKINAWKIISNTQSAMLYRDAMNLKIDASLKRSGSKIRRKRNIRYKPILD